MKRAVLVNGIPASGKSTVARGIAARTGWPVLALDTVKEPFFDELGPGRMSELRPQGGLGHSADSRTSSDREFNRALGRASYAVIWSLVREAPDRTTVVVDAWFGFQPVAVLERHLQRAGVEATVELWCHAPADMLVERFLARLPDRHPGHPGASFVPELRALAERGQPLRRGPIRDVDTSLPVDLDALAAWVGAAFAGAV
jgi:glucokinase